MNAFEQAPGLRQSFAIWVTGLPASGKSTLVRALQAQFASRGIDISVLESDALRPILTPHARYDDAERESFYRVMVFIGCLLTRHGVPVLFDATANRRAYREQARQQIPRFIEIYVECPLETCIARDSKGLYRMAREGAADTLPGFQSTYETPENPEFTVDCDRETTEMAATRIMAGLAERNFI